jgi:hypothetical protein
LHLDRLLDRPVREALAVASADLCAEWASVRTVTDRRSTPDTDAAYVLIATDTDDGLRAATLVAARYAPGVPIRYVDDPHTGPAVIEPGWTAGPSAPRSPPR